MVHPITGPHHAWTDAVFELTGGHGWPYFGYDDAGDRTGETHPGRVAIAGGIDRHPVARPVPVLRPSRNHDPVIANSLHAGRERMTGKQLLYIFTGLLNDFADFMSRRTRFKTLAAYRISLRQTDITYKSGNDAGTATPQ